MGSLVWEELDADAFLAAGSAAKPPADLAKQDEKARAKWANEHGDFVFLAAGKKQADLPPNSVMAYVKPAAAASGANAFLRADGSVITVDEAPEAAKVVEGLKAGKNPPPSLKE